MNSIKKTWNDIPSTAKTVREFGWILAGFLLVFPLLANAAGVLFAHRDFHYGWGWAVLSLTALALNVFAPRAMRVVYRLALFAAQGISWVLMRIVLAFVFYLVLSPMGLTMRLLGKDLLEQKMDRGTESYWKKRALKPGREQYERLF